MVQANGALPDQWVMLKPAATYRFLAQQPMRGGAWLGWRKLMLIAFVLGCTMSFIASTALTLRLAGPATVYWSFVPLGEIAALAAVSWFRKPARSFPQTVDLFLAGHGPWLLWLIGLCAIWSFLPPIRAFAFTNVWLYGAGAVVIVWSGYIDFCFFRFVMRRKRAEAGRDLALQRLLSWTLIIAVFGWPAIPPALVARFGP
jgi:hypothetical protein